VTCHRAVTAGVLASGARCGHDAQMVRTAARIGAIAVLLVPTLLCALGLSILVVTWIVGAQMYVTGGVATVAVQVAILLACLCSIRSLMVWNANESRPVSRT
jgi:hypothetical protein